jgi:hypothetical protein
MVRKLDEDRIDIAPTMDDADDLNGTRTNAIEDDIWRGEHRSHTREQTFARSARMGPGLKFRACLFDLIQPTVGNLVRGLSRAK